MDAAATRDRSRALIRWFCAHLEGSYVGQPGATLGPVGSRRYRLQVYRAALRDLAWLETPSNDGDGGRPAEPVVAPELGTLWQAQVEHAHVAGVRGPGTWYEGPIFDVRICEVQLSHPTESRGRAYGRIVGSAVGWLDLPPPAAHVLAPVEAVAAVQPVASGVVYVAPAASADARSTIDSAGDDVPASDEAAVPSGASDEASQGADVAGPLAVGGEAAAAAETPSAEASTALPSAAEARVPRYPAHLPLVAWVIALALGLALTSGGFAVSMWLLFMVPTLFARRLFGGVLRDSGAMRGVGFGLIALQILCASSVVSSLTESGCATTAFWPALAVVLVLFPTGLLPSAWPLAFSALGLTVVLAAFANGETTRCQSTAGTHAGVVRVPTQGAP